MSDLKEFADWKGYPLPPLNADGQFASEPLHREWVAFRAGLARRTQPEATAPAQDLSAAIDKDAKIAAQRARIMELEEQLARALGTPVNDWCPECHARESSGNALSAGNSLTPDQIDDLVFGYASSCPIGEGRALVAAILQSQKGESNANQA